MLCIGDLVMPRLNGGIGWLPETHGHTMEVVSVSLSVFGGRWLVPVPVINGVPLRDVYTYGATWVDVYPGGAIPALPPTPHEES